MFKKPYDVLELEVHADERGSLNEILRFKDHGVPGGGQLYVVSVMPGKRRGDHYHEKKDEWFTCVSGIITILIEDQNGNKNKVILDAKKPSVLYFAPGTAHTLVNDGEKEAVVVSYGSHQHDPADPDTYRKVIEL